MSSERQLRFRGDGSVYFLERLSDREIEVITLVAKGYTNTQIARALFISSETVKSHIRRTLLKLDAATRAQAVVRALQSGQLALADL